MKRSLILKSWAGGGKSQPSFTPILKRTWSYAFCSPIQQTLASVLPKSALPLQNWILQLLRTVWRLLRERDLVTHDYKHQIRPKVKTKVVFLCRDHLHNSVNDLSFLSNHLSGGRNKQCQRTYIMGCHSPEGSVQPDSWTASAAFSLNTGPISLIVVHIRILDPKWWKNDRDP
jgi:hypothetical protein